MQIDARGFQQDLIRWYRRTARDLPWRTMRDPYAIWISEIILQQTRVEQGAAYFERFLRAFPTVQALASAGEETVLKLWEGLGYYARARNLHRCAKAVVTEHAGRFPDSPEGLRALPGIGPYTAGAIASIAFGRRAAAVDGNVIRVLSRVFDIPDSIETPATRRRIEALAEGLVPAKAPGDFNQALMDLGAGPCRPGMPACSECPVRRHCRAAARGVQEDRPVRRKKKDVPHQDRLVAAVKKRGRYLIMKRPSKGLLGGLWEFPSFPAHGSGSEQKRLHTLVRERLGLDVIIGPPVTLVQHAYSHFTLSLRVFRCDYAAGELSLLEHVDAKWVFPSQFPRYAFSKANHKFLLHL